MVSKLHEATSASTDGLPVPLAIPMPPSPINAPAGGTPSQARVATVTTTLSMSVKLTKLSYLIWKIQIVPIVKAQGLGKHLTHPPPSEEADTDDENTPWKRNNQQVLSTIISSMRPELLPVVSGCLTARDAWEKLATELSYASESRIMELTSRFHSIKKGTKSLDEYISEFRQLLAELVNAGKFVANRTIKFFFLRGLGSKFCSFCTGVTTRNENLSFDDLLASLRAEVSLDNFGSDDEAHAAPIAPMVNQTQSNLSNNNQGFFTNQYQATNRDRNQRYVTRNNDNRGRGGRNGHFIPRCQLCLKQGHRAPECQSIRIPSPMPMMMRPPS
ncbi:uncharacterized protein LOC144711383 [Wolffia australiana]